MEFTQKQVAAITKVNAGTLQAWARDGLVKPSIADAKGRGSARLYSPADLVHIAVIKILSDMSFNRALILSLSQQLNRKTMVSIPPDPRIPHGGLTMKDTYMDPSNPLGITVDILAVTQNHWTVWGRSTTATEMFGEGGHTKGQIPKREATLLIDLGAIKERIRKAIA